MTQEFQYTVQQRRCMNQAEGNEYPDPPNWGEWSEWATISRSPYQSLAGAAMAARYHKGLHRSYGRNSEGRRPYMKTEARVAYRKVPKEWTPLLPELGEEE